MTSTNGHPHIEDGDLVCLLSDEVTAEERALATAHLARCGDCALRLERYREEFAALGGLVARMPVPAIDPARRARSLSAVRQAAVLTVPARDLAPAAAASRPAPALRVVRPRFAFAFSDPMARAAAVASLLFATGLAASSPAGAWVADVWHGLFGNEPVAATTVEAPESGALSAPLGSVVAFVPAEAEFVIELGSLQTQGSLDLRIEATRSASARMSGGEGDISVMVLPSSLKIENEEGSSAGYDIVIPHGLERVRIRVGDAPDILLDPMRLGAGWSATVDLRTGTLRARDPL